MTRTRDRASCTVTRLRAINSPNLEVVVRLALPMLEMIGCRPSRHAGTNPVTSAAVAVATSVRSSNRQSVLTSTSNRHPRQRNERCEHRRRPHGERKTSEPSQCRQHSRFGDQLAHDAHSPCAQGRAGRELRLARCAAQQHEPGDAGGGNQQHERDQHLNEQEWHLELSLHSVESMIPTRESNTHVSGCDRLVWDVRRRHRLRRLKLLVQDGQLGLSLRG